MVRTWHSRYHRGDVHHDRRGRCYWSGMCCVCRTSGLPCGTRPCKWSAHGNLATAQPHRDRSDGADIRHSSFRKRLAGYRWAPVGAPGHRAGGHRRLRLGVYLVPQLLLASPGCSDQLPGGRGGVDVHLPTRTGFRHRRRGKAGPATRVLGPDSPLRASNGSHRRQRDGSVSDRCGPVGPRRGNGSAGPVPHWSNRCHRIGGVGDFAGPRWSGDRMHAGCIPGIRPSLSASQVIGSRVPTVQHGDRKGLGGRPEVNPRDADGESAGRWSRRRVLTVGVAGVATVVAGAALGLELVSRGVLPGQQELDRIDGACSVTAPPLRFSTTGVSRSGSFFSKARGRTIGYTIAWPPGHGPGSAVPLIVMLHGEGANHANALDGDDSGSSGRPRFRRRASATDGNGHGGRGRWLLESTPR